MNPQPLPKRRLRPSQAKLRSTIQGAQGRSELTARHPAPCSSWPRALHRGTPGKNLDAAARPAPDEALDVVRGLARPTVAGHRGGSAPLGGKPARSARGAPSRRTPRRRRASRRTRPPSAARTRRHPQDEEANAAGDLPAGFPARHGGRCPAAVEPATAASVRAAAARDPGSGPRTPPRRSSGCRPQAARSAPSSGHRGQARRGRPAG